MASLLLPQQPFPLIIFDLEWNQGYGKQNTRQDSLPQEIVEIGAVRLNAAFQIESELSLSVRPVVHPSLHHHVRRITGLENASMRDGMSFVEACALLMRFCGDQFTLCTWGPDDYPVLLKNLTYWQLPLQWATQPLDIQAAFAALSPDRPGQQIALSTAMETLSIAQDKPLHRALHDAYYTARVFQALQEQVAPMPDTDPRLIALCKRYASQALRYTARTTVVPTASRSIAAMLRTAAPPLPACPICQSALSSASACIHVGRSQHLEQLATCPTHGMIWMQFALHYNAEGFVLIKTKAMLCGEEQQAAFQARCERVKAAPRDARADSPLAIPY